MSPRQLILTAPLALALSGCWFGKKVAVAPPPRAPQPVAAAPAPAPPPAPVNPEEALPAIEPAPAPSPEALQTEPPPETPVAPPKKKPAPKKRPAPAPANPEVPAVAPPANPPAKLGEVLTADRRRQYQTDFTRSAARARAALNQTKNVSLTATQRETVERIQTFLQQADQARSGDLATAVQLARRADLLAQDLRKSLQ